MPAAIPLAIAGSAVVGAIASNRAAHTQADAANNASSMQWNEFNTVRNSMQPYTNMGYAGINPMLNAMGYTPGANGTWQKDMANPLNQQFSFNPNDLTKTPGYQFALQQGMQGVNNSSAAKGLGMSSANMRDAARYATGLADQTYGDQFNRALQSYETNYNSAANNASRLAGVVQMGQNSAAGVGNQGLQTAMNSGDLLTSGANAQAAGMIGGANAVNGAVGNGLNYYMANQMLNKMGGQSWPGGMYSGYNFTAQ